MARNNLRIVYANKAATVNGSATSAALNDYKSSTTTSALSYTVTTSVGVSGAVCVAVMVAKNIGALTMSVTASSVVSNADTSTSQISTGPAIGYGGVRYMAVYFTGLGSTTVFTINFNTSVEVSRIIVGNYWSPVYNTQFGVSVGFQDDSSHERLQSGDLYTINRPRYKTLNFELQYMDETDKFKLYDIIRGLGKTTPMFVSVFPEDSDKEKEHMYQIYGKFEGLPGISHVMFTMYAASLQLVEI